MTHEPALQALQQPLQDETDSLHRALRQALVPPHLPAGFRAQLLARVQTEQVADLQARRQQLDIDYQRERQQLQANYRRLRRDRLALIVAGAFSAGVCVSLLLPWLYAMLGAETSTSAGLVALVMTLALGAGLWLERSGRPGLPGFGVD